MFAEELGDQRFLALVASREHDEIGRQLLAARELGAVGDEAGDVGELEKAHLALHH